MATKKEKKLITRKRENNINTTSTTSTTTEQKLFEYQGKLYAVGAILTIGSDPYYVDNTKKNHNRLIKKNKKSTAQSRLLYKIGYKADEDDIDDVDEDEEVSTEERNDESEDEEENEDDEDGDEQEEKKVKKKKVTEASIKNMAKAELIAELSTYQFAIKKSATIPELKDALTTLIKKKVKKLDTDEYDFKFQEVNLLSKPVLKMAMDLGLNKKNLKITKLKPYPVQYGKLNNVEVHYKFYNQFIVVEDGSGGLKLEEYNIIRCRMPKNDDEFGMTTFDDGYENCNNKQQTKILDLDVLPPLVPNKYNPIRTELPKPPPSYTGKLQIGNYVKFTSTSGKLRQIDGIIIGYNNGFLVKELTTNIDWCVSYDDMTIKHVNIGYGNHYKLGARITKVVLEDFLYEQISDTTRRYTTNLFFETLAELVSEENGQVISGFIPGIYAQTESDTESKNQINDNTINWELISQPLKTWEGYYGEQFRNWLYKKMYPLLYGKTPEFDTDHLINKLLDKLLDTFGDDLFDNDGEFMLNKMSEMMTDDAFFVFVRSKLYNHGYNNLRNIRGSSLASFIAYSIDGYLIYKSIPAVEYSIKEEWISSEFIAYNPTVDDRLEFDTEFLSTLHELYTDYARTWKLSYKKSLNGKRSNKRSKNHNEKVSTFKGKLLTTKGAKLLEDVQVLENNIYNLPPFDGFKYGNGPGVNFDYLRNVVELLMYLDPIDNVGKYAKYLRSKIVAGLFDVRTLCDLTNIEKFPEFFINNDLDKDQYDICSKQLDYEVYNKMVAYIDLWFFNVNQRLSEQKFPWKKYTKLVALNCNATRVRKDLEFKGLEHNSENYDCHEIAENLYSCLAKVEPIPDEDIIISYDKQTNKFVCNSLNDILYALKDQDDNKEALNFITGKPYDLEFLESMRNRYSNLLKTTELPERNVLSFTTNREDLEFYWLFTEYYNNKPRLPVKRTRQVTTITNTISGSSNDKLRSNKRALTLSTALSGVEDGQTLCIIFKPADIPIETFRESYTPLVKLNKIKVVIIETDGSNYDSMLKDLRKQKIVDKIDVPIWIMVPTNEDKEPSIVYRKEIKKQNITIQKKFQQALKTV